MKKIIKLFKSDSTYLLVIIHVITTLALILFISLKYDWIVEQFGSYSLFVIICAPIGGFIVGTYYLLLIISRGISTGIKKARITIMIEIALKDGRTFTSNIDLIEAVTEWNNSQGFGVPFRVSESLWVSGEQIVRIEVKSEDYNND